MFTNKKSPKQGAKTNLISRFGKNTAGAVAIIVALVVPVLAGLVGLAVDAGAWYYTLRSLQTAADAGAMAAANQIAVGQGSSSAEEAALGDSRLNGYDVTGTGTFVLQRPPTSGAFIGDNQAVEVVLSEVSPLYFSSLFLSEGVTIEVRAVAKVFMQAEMCLVALEKDSGPGLTISGSVTLSMDCGMAANSSETDAISISGTADITATSLWTMGNIDNNGSGTLNVDTIYEQASEIDDPYAALEVPAYGGCDHNNTRVNTGSVTLSPGVYCGGLTIGANADVTLEAGEYIFDGGDLSITGQGSLSGSEVTLFLTSSSGGDYGGIKIAGGGDVTLSAPTSGANEGLLIYVDREAPSDAGSLGGNASGDLQGVIYTPTQDLTFHGTGDAGDGCLNVIARRIDVVGDVGLTNDCYDAGVENPVSKRARLVE